MPRPCKVCNLPPALKKEVDGMILAGATDLAVAARIAASATTDPAVAARIGNGIHRTAIQRHRNAHGYVLGLRIHHWMKWSISMEKHVRELWDYLEDYGASNIRIDASGKHQKVRFEYGGLERSYTFANKPSCDRKPMEKANDKVELA